MENKKAIFLDIDGTIVDYDGNIPPSAISAIQQARKNGHKVILTTGRSKAEIYDHLWDIGVDGLIGGNGSYVEYQGTVIQHQVIPVESVKKAITWMKKYHIGYYLECNSGLYGSSNLPYEAAKIIGEPTEENMDKIRSIFPLMIYSDDIIPDDVNKISFVLPSAISLDEIKEQFDDKFLVGSWSLTGKSHEFGEFGQKGINKGTAVRKLLDHLQLDLKYTVAFGDGLNDMELITLCHVGVAMGNAEERLKEVADFVTKPVNEDGLYHGFSHFGLI